MFREHGEYAESGRKPFKSASFRQDTRSVFFKKISGDKWGLSYAAKLVKQGVASPAQN